MSAINVESYQVTDPFFGAPVIDVDDERELPTPHRFVHGYFEGTSTRFAIAFPPADVYQGRLYQPLEGANAGHEN
ncbi:MAG: hypothetical protein Q8L05_01440, partial [Actinomycetota bacterium]|nr:hypothetical protein [Actinomycetota bacterium]